MGLRAEEGAPPSSPPVWTPSSCGSLKAAFLEGPGGPQFSPRRGARWKRYKRLLRPTGSCAHFIKQRDMVT